MSLNTDNVRDAVKAYSAFGLRCVPLFGVQGGKCLCNSPTCKPRDHGKHEPPATEGQWKDGRIFGPESFQPTDNVAVALGPWRPGKWLVCLDFDGTKIPSKLLPGLPETLTQSSPRGIHLFFSVPEFEPLGNWVDCLSTRESGAQLDLRYARGRIVVSPSRGASGKYEWLNFKLPEPLPASALNAIYSNRRRRGLPVLSHWDRGEKQA